MNSIPPAWFDVPGFNWNDLSRNGRIAARWVHAGAEVFPCYSRVSADARGNIHEVKTPKTPKGFKDATDNMLAVVRWWTENPGDLVGVPAGDHLTIIDIDMDSDKEKAVDGWASLHEAGLTVPEDYMVTTPRGGNHVYCGTPEAVSPNSVANLRLSNGTVLKGVDRRARGGYFIGWSEEGIPDSIADLPFAPLEFCHVSSGSSRGVEYSGTVTDWLTSVGAGQPDALMKSLMDSKIPRGEFNHQEMRDIQRNIVGVAAEGHPGGAVALEKLRSEYLRGEYNTIQWESDFNAALAGAIMKYGSSTDTAVTERSRSHSVAAVQIAADRYDFFPTTDGDVLAVPKKGPKVCLSIEGNKDFYSTLALDFFDAFDSKKALSDKAYKEAVRIIQGRCSKLAKVDAHLRVAELEDATYVDLGDETGRCVRITSDGWTIEEESPVLFRRTKLISPLPEPVRGGNLKEFFNLINIPAAREPLYLGFLVSFYFPHISHPILCPLGSQGSGKSKVSEYTARLLDNSPVIGRKLPRNIEEWVVTAQASFLISLDNVSKLDESMSDALCRAVTRDGAVHRSLYTNKDVEIFEFRRVVILNGIDILGIREDLADRLLVMELQAIAPEQRLTETGLDVAFAEMAPQALGALFDVVVKVKQALPQVQLKNPPRMADFAKILQALEDVHPGMVALEEYRLGIEESAMNAIAGDPVLSALVDVITEPWEGTSKDLLDLLNTKKPLFDEARKFWPSKPLLMTSILRRSGPAFAKIGWVVEDLGNRNQDKTKRWRIAPPKPWKKKEKATPPGEERSHLNF